MPTEPGSEAPVDSSSQAANWLVVRAARKRRWGGEIRRQLIFKELAEQTRARQFDTWGQMRRYITGRLYPPFMRPNRLGRHLAASEQPHAYHMPWIVEKTDPVVVAIYDDPVAQTRALGVDLTPEREAEMERRRSLAMSSFRWLVVPTRSFAEMAGLDMDRVIVGGNGTITEHVRPGPWPDVPSIGFASGAAPGRGIEALIEASRMVRSSWPDLRLYLWLVATSPDGELYVERLRTELRDDPWIKIGPVGYAHLGPALAKATILTIPHPANEYMDVALPVKLLDSMAAGRPLVVTPRRETAAIVERTGTGLITRGDAPADLADSFNQLLSDEALARRLGATAREVAVREFDWGIVGARIAGDVLQREADLHR
jgi:glycosyltransferase involved in cell wall biosynthesis